MINKEKVSKMIKLSLMESGENESKLNIAKYRHADFITNQLILSITAGVCCFAGIEVLWIAVRWNQLNTIVKSNGVGELIKRSIIAFSIFLILYLGISFVIARRRYKKAVAYRESYLQKLQSLESYQKEIEANERKAGEDGSVT